MGFWAAAGQVAGTVAGSVLGAQANKAIDGSGSTGGELQTPGFHNSGWTGGKSGVLQTANKFLGSNVGKLSTDVAGGFLNDYRQRRNTRNNFRDLESQGLTPQEIAGGGGGGKQASTGNTLGSGPATQVLSQQQFTAGENQKQRAHEIEKTKLQTRAPMGQLALSEKLNPLQMQIMEQNKVLIGTQINKNINDLTYYWETMFSRMSRENVMASLAAFASGTSIKQVLLGIGSEEERQVASGLYDDLIASNSRYLIEAVGIGGWLSRLFTNEGIISYKQTSKTPGQILNKFNPFNINVKQSENNKVFGKIKLNRDGMNPMSPSFGRVWKKK